MNSVSHVIYSIGYGNRTRDAFFELLRKYQIQAVCDVRSAPYSTRNPDFNREQLQRYAKENRVYYIFMGDLLGARPSDPDYYVNGKASYAAMSESSAFRQGVERVEIGAEKYRLALMCAEKEPLDCHRAILVSRFLVKDGMKVEHIDANGELETHASLESRLVKLYGLQQTSLLDDRDRGQILSEAYEKRGSELAYDVVAAYKVKSG